MRGPSLLLAALLVSGCVPADPPRTAIGASQSEFDYTALDLAARQVQRCYRAPRIASSGRQIVTRLRIRVSADGQIAGLPTVIIQDGVTPANQGLADRMAEAAIEAVLRCAPLHFPPSYFQDGFTEFDLTFSPLARG
jgi:hypothetical protein